MPAAAVLLLLLRGGLVVVAAGAPLPHARGGGVPAAPVVGRVAPTAAAVSCRTHAAVTRRNAAAGAIVGSTITTLRFVGSRSCC